MRKEDPLQERHTGNPYYDYLVHEVQVVCECDAAKATTIVSYVNSLGSNPLDFIKQLPEYTGEQHPNADGVIRALEDIREKAGIRQYKMCFPEGYVNRKERRRQDKARRKAEKKGR